MQHKFQKRRLMLFALFSWALVALKAHKNPLTGMLSIVQYGIFGLRKIITNALSVIFKPLKLLRYFFR